MYLQSAKIALKINKSVRTVKTHISTMQGKGLTERRKGKRHR